jgi:hypothetical protein
LVCSPYVAMYPMPRAHLKKTERHIMKRDCAWCSFPK